MLSPFFPSKITTHIVHGRYIYIWIPVVSALIRLKCRAAVYIQTYYSTRVGPQTKLDICTYIMMRNKNNNKTLLRGREKEERDGDRRWTDGRTSTDKLILSSSSSSSSPFSSSSPSSLSLCSSLSARSN